MINQHQFQQSARHFRSGRISLSEFQSRVFAGTEAKPHETKSTEKGTPSAAVEAVAAAVKPNLDTADRCGWSEVICGQGKSTEALVAALSQLKSAGQPAMITRLSDATGNELAKQITEGNFNSESKTFTCGTHAQKKTFGGDIAVIAAGPSDLPVLEETCSTIRWMGANAINIDVGSEGVDGLTPHLETLKAASAIVVVAGTEKALPGVVANHAGCPVFVVPTSAGFESNQDGIASLLAMLNNCPANVAWVNIDAGFKAGYLAAMVAANG
ncbi:nickel pincer cofactor biosynthesis protein LarB [bacterium]|nr:nickel pincer cofactor biosynthesis protein LarB [bacterium]